MRHLQVPAIQEFKRSLKYLKDFNIKLTNLKYTSIMTLIDIVDYINEENLNFNLTYSLEDIRYYNNMDIGKANYLYLLTRILSSLDYDDTPSHWKNRIIHYIKNTKNLNFKNDIAKIAKDTFMSESDARFIFNHHEYELTPIMLDNIDFSSVMTEKDFYRIIEERFPQHYKKSYYNRCQIIIAKNNSSLYEMKENQRRERLLKAKIERFEAARDREIRIEREKEYYSKLFKKPVRDLNSAIVLFNNIMIAIEQKNNEYLQELGIDPQEFLAAT